jgi:hypothetical protein
MVDLPWNLFVLFYFRDSLQCSLFLRRKCGRKYVHHSQLVEVVGSFFTPRRDTLVEHGLS